MGSGSPVLTVDDVENTFDSLMRGARSGDFTDQPTGRHGCRGQDILQPVALCCPSKARICRAVPKCPAEIGVERSVSSSDFALQGFFAKESQQFGVDFVCVSPGDAVWASVHNVKASALDELCGALSRRLKRNDTVIVSVNYQRWHIDASHILSEIFMPRGNASQAGHRRSVGSNIPAGAHRFFPHALTQQQIGVVEVLEELGEKGIAVRRYRLLNAFEHAEVYPFLVVRRFEEKGRDRRDKDGMAYVLRSMLADVTRHFAAAHREPNQRKVA